MIDGNGERKREDEDGGAGKLIKITVSSKKALETDGERKQLFSPEDRGIIPATSGCFPPKITVIWLRGTRKNPKIFRTGILLR